MRIKIVGSLGYLGNRISTYLINRNYNITNTSRDLKKKIDRNDIFIINFSSESNLNNFCCDADVVIYAAGRDQKNCNTLSKKTLKFEEEIFNNFYDIVLANKVKKFIYISTSQVYASSDQFITEESKLYSKDAYTNRHINAENYIINKNNHGFTKNIILRLSNAFGYPINKNANCWHLAINDFVLNCVINNEIKIKSTEDIEKNFVGISYLCECIEFLTKLNLTQNNNIFNVGNSKSYRLSEITKIIKDRNYKITKKISKINLFKSSNKNLQKLNYCCEKLKSIGFRESNEKDIINEIDDLFEYCINR